MATIYNSDLSKELIQGGKIQTSKESIPTQLAEKVVPVMEVNPKLLRRCNFSKVTFADNTASANIFTTPSDKDTFLIGATLSYIKDATSTSTYTRIRFTDETGLTTTLLVLKQFTLTAGNDSISLTLPYPIKVARNTNITIENSTNVANISASGVIYGYFVENINS